MAAYSTSSLSLLFYPQSPPESEMYRFTMAGAKQFYSPIGDAFAVNGLADLCCLVDDLWNILLNTENIPSFFATQNASLGCVTFASSLNLIAYL